MGNAHRRSVVVLVAAATWLIAAAGCGRRVAHELAAGAEEPVRSSSVRFEAAGPGGSGPARPCSDYPTIARIDCSLFPSDPGAARVGDGSVLYVSTSGRDQSDGASPDKALRSVGEALRRARAGGTIYVAGGRYAEGRADDYRALDFDKKDVVVRALGDGDVVVVPATPDIKVGIRIAASGVIVDGIDVRGFTSALVTLESGTRNIVLENMTVSGGASDFVDGIVAPDEGGVDGVLIRNVRVEGANLGISCNVGPCRNWWIDRVTVKGTGAGDDSGADAIASEVRNEEASEQDMSSNWLLTNVEVSGASGDGIDMKAVRVAIFNANVHDNNRNGVKLWRGGDLVNSFVVNHGADAAVVLDRAGTYRLLHSLVAYENFGAGPSHTMTVGYDRPEESVTLSIVNSVFFNNSGSIFLSAGTSATIHNCLLGNTDTNELVVKGDVQITEASPVRELDRLSDASGNLPFDAAPKYAKPPVDFGFSSASPLVDAGALSERLPSFDFRGLPRTKGKAPDLGPLELF